MLKKLQILMLAFFAITLSTNAQTIFSENFNGANALSNWTLIDNDGLTPQPNYAFFTDAWISFEDPDTTGVSDSVAASTSWYQPSGQADDYLISPQITLQPNSLLEFDAQASDAGFPDGYEVLISTTTPTIAGLQANPVLLSVPAENPSWTRRRIDLSAYSGNVYIAIRNNSTDRNILFIDNFSVEVATGIDDAVLTTVARTSSYSRIPQNQSTNPMVFIALVNNAGQDTLTNVKLRYDVDQSGSIVFSDSTTVSFIAPGDDSLFLDISSFVPNAIGRYQVNYTVSHDSVDAVISNNSRVSDSLLVTDSTFARDNNRLTGFASLAAGTRGEFGNVYNLSTSDTLTSVSFLVGNGNGQLAGRPLFYLVRSYNNGTPGAILASSDTVGLPSTAQNVLIRLDVATGGVVLPADSFFVSVVQIDSALTIGTTTEKFTAGTALINLGTNFVPIENTTLGARTFFIRPHFGNNGIITSLVEGVLNNQGSIDLKMYPNPSNGQFKIDLIKGNLNQDIEFQLYNVSGKLVHSDSYTPSEFLNNSFDFQHLEKGIYFARITSSNEQVVKNIVIK
jgi:hypothetical protein